jgi:hypothetical protein
MTDEQQPYGGQLCEKLKELKRLDLITRKLSYDAIQQLKAADRAETLKLFRGSHYDFLQLIKTREPAEVAAHLLQKEKENADAMIVMVAMTMIMPP